MYQIRLVCQSSPTVVTAYAHHAVVYEEIHRGNGLRVGEVAMIGLGGAWSAVFYGVATFQRIIGHVHLESAVGYKEQAFFCLAGECTPIYICPVIVFLRADVGFVHVFDARGVFTEELRSAAVAVVFFRTASVVGQRSLLLLWSPCPAQCRSFRLSVPDSLLLSMLSVVREAGLHNRCR